MGRISEAAAIQLNEIVYRNIVVNANGVSLSHTYCVGAWISPSFQRLATVRTTEIGALIQAQSKRFLSSPQCPNRFRSPSKFIQSTAGGSFFGVNVVGA